MKYISGMLAFGIPCEKDSNGKWNTTKSMWLNEDLLKLKESSESPFKDYGIECNKIIPHHEYCLYNVADHVRAYMDMLYECRFDELYDLFDECIGSMKCRQDIFMLTLGKLRNTENFKEINEFMTKEFGNAWLSYISSVMNVSEKMASRYEEMEINLT